MPSKIYRAIGLAAALATLSACKTRAEADSAVLSTTAACKPVAKPGEPPPKPTQRKQVPSTTYFKALPPNHANKKAVLVFYSVDTKEKYFQAALAYELASLKVACDGKPTSSHVNFVFWANSLLTGPEPRFYACRAGKFSVEPLSGHPKLASKLATQTACIAKGPAESGNFSGQPDECAEALELPITYSALMKEAFATHPMAHPGVLMSIIRYGWELFPREEYVEFWHMKSHGSENLFLTGLTDDQAKSKDDCQDSIVAERLKIYNEKHKTNFQASDVVWPEWGTVGQKPVKTYGLAIALAGLAGTGNGAGLGKDNDPDLKIDGNQDLKIDGNPDLKIDENPDLKIDGNPDLKIDENPDLKIDGNIDLGVDSSESLSIEDSFASLGTAGLGTDGLGAKNHFGVGHSALGASLIKLGMDDDSQAPLGFLFAESCDSRMQARSTMQQAFQELLSLDGYFSAGGSLWYRNLDYNHILREWSAAGGGAKKLQDWMIRAAQKVKAFVNE